MSGSYDNLNAQNHNLYSEPNHNGSGFITPATRRKRTSNWIKFGIPVLLIVIVAAVVGGVLGSRKKNNNSSSSAVTSSPQQSAASASAAAGAAASAKLALGKYATATNSEFMMPIYPSTTDTGAFSSPTFIPAAQSKTAWPTDPFQPSNPDVLTVRKDRPLLIAPAYKWAALPALIANDPYLQSWNATIFKNATEYAALPAVVYNLDGDSGILDNSRAVKQRVKAFAYAYRMTNDTSWVDLAWREIKNAAGNGTVTFGPSEDRWNSGHFLDVAEMSAAYGIAYDWLYDVWTPSQKSMIITTLLQYGLQPGVTQITTSAGWWTGSAQTPINGNWNCVCNGGMTMASLAILNDDTSGVAKQLLQFTVGNAKTNCAQAVSTDGSWAETANYWYFGTTGHAEMAASLLSATGSHYGLLDVNTNFYKTGDFHMYITGSTSLFNYGDHGPNKYSTTANSMLFYGDFYNQPQYALFQRDQYDSAEPWSMFWYNPAIAGAFWDGKPLDHVFDNGVDQWASMRSTWTDINGLYVAMKAGMLVNHQTHNDLDVGDFVLDALGTRWAGELGSADYLSPGYFTDAAQDGARWKYYRKMTEGQNTILINQANQDLTAAPTIKFDTSNTTQGPTTVNVVPDDSTAFFTTDMTSAYFDATSVKRGIRLLNGRKQVLLQDEVTASQSVMWRMHTNATVTIDASGTSATLALDGQTLKIAMLSPPDGAQFKTGPAVRFSTDPTPPEADQENPGVTVLMISLPAGTYTLQVLFNPQWPGSVNYVTPPTVAIDSWSLRSHDSSS
ncbi:heparinase II/III family protein [Mycena metata]|uniref:Heparinase II/III family protein n=1 Tax=Mycena metata TaxID=1033252 RepID=A0AAD7MP55_9AGAR|nr:heparinase II/III family protein [Mycena metata]